MGDTNDEYWYDSFGSKQQVCVELRYINLINHRKLGIHDSITRHPYPCITRKISIPPKKTFNQMIEIGFHSRTMEWTWTDEDINILKESFQSLMAKQDWIHTKCLSLVLT